MAPVPDMNGDDSLLYTDLNPNCLFEDAILNDPEQRDDEEIFELSSEIRLDMSIFPIAFEGSCWNESQNSSIVNYVPENLIAELININEIKISELDSNFPDIPTIQQEHSYSQSPESCDDDSLNAVNNDEEIEDICIAEEIENLDLDDDTESIDLDKIDIEDIETDEMDFIDVEGDDDDDDDDDDYRTVTENILMTVNAEVMNRPRRGRPRRKNYTRLITLGSENRENNGRRTKGKKKMDERTRALHNTKERDRRHALKRDVAYLAEKIPNLPNRRPMNLVLQKAVDYIKKLQTENDKYEKEFNKLRKMNETLTKEFQKLKRVSRRK